MVKMNPEIIEAIKNRKPPRNLKELQSFLSLSGYYRRFVLNYAKIAAPLYGVTSPNNKWFWSKLYDQAVAF